MKAAQPTPKPRARFEAAGIRVIANHADGSPDYAAANVVLIAEVKRGGSIRATRYSQH